MLTDNKADKQLVRGVSLKGATALNMIDMIGVGPFITIPLIVAAMGGPQAMIGWIIGAIICLSDGLVWAELGAAMPHAGGSYNYLKEIYGKDSFGKLVSFLFMIAVDDVMVPRHRIEALDLATDPRNVRAQLATCFHNKLPVFESEINRVVGMLHVRRALGLLQHESFDADDLRAVLTEPYFVPSGTPVFRQLQFFQENRQRIGLVIDEYGEVLGLVTLEDIIEEIIGEFTTTAPGGDTALQWVDDEVTVDGSAPLRELNRRLGTQFPLDGPRTLNGLLLEILRELPEAATGLRYGPLVVEIQQIEDRLIRSVRLRRRPSDLSPHAAEDDERAF